MRVLHLDSGREMRGGQFQVLFLLEKLGAGHLLMTAADGPLMHEARKRGIEVQPLSLVALARASRTADLVHAHDARCHTWAAAAGCAPLVVSRRVAFGVRRSPLSRWKYARADRYIAVSKHVETTLIQAGIPPEIIDVVYDGVRVPEKMAQGTRVLAPKSDDPMKGSDLVHQAAQIARIPVEFSDDLARDLPEAKLLVYITRSEGLGSAALLAMAYGVPVVASNVGGLPEFVVGELTDNDPEAIATAMLHIIGREDLGARARRVVEERFTIERMARETLAAYGRVVAS